MNKKTIWISILVVILLGISWSYSLFYKNQYSISKPIFFKHYIYRTFDKDESYSVQFYMYYLSPKGNPNKVYQSNFKGFAPMEVTDQVNETGYYQVHNLSIEVPRTILNQLSIDKQSIFKNMTMKFTNGNTEVVPVGEIIFEPLTIKKDTYPLTMTASGSSSSNLGFTSNKLIENITVQHVTIPFEERIKNSFLIELAKEKRREPDFDGFYNRLLKNVGNSKLSLPKNFQRDDTMKWYYGFHFSPNQPERFSVFDFEIPFDMKGEQGKIYHGRLLNADYKPNFTFKNLKEFVKNDKGGER